MVEIMTTKMSSKGQIVIPKEFRADFLEGDEILLLKEGGKIILKNKKEFSKQLEEDLEFARRTEEALTRLENGEGTEMDFDEFIKEIKQW